MRTRTVLLTVGRRGTPPPELGPRIPGSVEVGGRVIERRGASLVDVFVVGCAGEENTGPAIEA
jgi:hypothetical protein